VTVAIAVLELVHVALENVDTDPSVYVPTSENENGPVAYARLGKIASDTRIGDELLTVTVNGVLVMAPVTAVILHTPGATAVIIPAEEIVHAAVLSLFHDPGTTFGVDPSENVPVAVATSTAPVCRVEEFAATDMDTRVAVLTVTVQYELVMDDPDTELMLQDPAATAVTRPPGLVTVQAAVLLLAYDDAVTGLDVPLLNIPMVWNCNVDPPTVMVFTPLTGVVL
jgi:hypothetical protein